jgi:PPM family protein phosphatase
MKTISKTDVGKVRTNNEDSILIDEKRGIFILADGMGGHNAGEVASKLAVDTAHDFLKDYIVKTKDDEEILRILDSAVVKAHEAIKEKAYSDINLRDMGTTIVVLVIKKKRAYLCHAGDSRAYLLRDSLEQLTKDHTMGEYLVDKKIMPREQVPLQQWHTLTQAVGVGNAPAADKKYVDIKKGDLLLVCSDGLTDMLTDEEITAILKKDNNNINDLADSLVAEANDRGGRDNISVVLVQQI